MTLSRDVPASAAVTGTELLEARDVVVRFGGLVALDHVNISLRRGEIFGLIGPNGAGKSTCFNMLNGQTAPDAGKVHVLERDTTGLKPREVWRLGVGRTFQITATFPTMTVRENVQVALSSYDRKLFNLVASMPRYARGEADRLLDLVGMGGFATRPCGELAYGDLKRLELAIALANQPKLLLMDEPTAGMAPRERIELMRLTAQIAREKSIGILFTEHDMDVVFEHADRILVLNRGVLIAEGSPEEVRSNAEVRAIYLGEGLVYDARHRQGDSEGAAP
jgi:branched-chain amino acid transport system ATP-binding protein